MSKTFEEFSNELANNTTPALTDQAVGLTSGSNMRVSLQAIKDLYDANAILSLTYAEAQTLVAASGLNAGGLYLITDATDGNIELILTAATTSAFSTNAVNPLFPERTVVYDFERNLLLNSIDQTEAVGLSNYPTTLYDWVLKNASTTTVSNRDGSGLVKMRQSPNSPYYAYLLGGWDPVFDPVNITNNEVYRFSTDFTTTTRLADAGWSKRHTFCYASEENKCWVWGSDTQGGMPGQVECWEGVQNADLTITWTLKNADCGWGASILKGGCRHNGSLFCMGGQTNDTNNANPKTDVWRSDDDGATWTQIATGLTFLGMNLNGTVASFNGYIWKVAGGEYKTPTSSGTFLNTVYRSADGITWEQMPTPPFGGRQYPMVMAHENKLFLICGSNAAGNLSDCWTMDAFGNWEQVPLGITSRHAAPAISILNKILLATGNYKNDTWVLEHKSGTKQYREGTWMPTNAVVSLNPTNGEWTKQGSQVTLYFNVKCPVNASGASFLIQNLPFTPRTGGRNGGVIGFSDLGIDFTMIALDSNVIRLNKKASPFSAITNAEFSGKELYGIITYLTSD